MNSDDTESLGCFLQICVNDDLVAKKFAYYDSQSVDGKWLDEAEQTPIMLSCCVLTQTARKTMQKKKTIDKINLPPGQHTLHAHNIVLLRPDAVRMGNCSTFCGTLRS